jgi:hypothetical protein
MPDWPVKSRCDIHVMYVHYAIITSLLRITYRAFEGRCALIKGVGSDVHERLYRPEPV